MLFFCKRHSPVAFKHCRKGFSWQVMQYGAPLFPRKWRSMVKVVHWTENKGLLVTWSPDQTANRLQIINGHRFRKWSHNRAGSEKRRRRPNKVWRSIKWIQRKSQDSTARTDDQLTDQLITAVRVYELFAVAPDQLRSSSSPNQVFKNRGMK